MSNECCVVLVTVSSKLAAQRIAHALVEEKLAACCNLIDGIESVYRWKGEVCSDPEMLMVIKSTQDRFEALRARLIELHSYDVPEVIMLPITDGNEDYLNWIRDETQP